MNKVLSFFFAILIAPAMSFADSTDDAYNALAQISTRACCKVCVTSKPCGDSCISASFNCSKGAGCACSGSGNSGSGSNGGGSSKPGGSNSGGKPSNNKPGGSSNGGSGSGSNKPPNSGNNSQPECPAIIARIDSLTYAPRKHYRCFPKVVNAENKSFVREPEDGSLNSKALVDLSVKRVKCPKIIVDKRTKLFTTNAEYLCYENKTKAKKAGFKVEN